LHAVTQLSGVNLEALSSAQQTPVSQLGFVKEALRQIVACRRTLKWTYAFGFYSFSDDAPGAAQRKQFFEYAQGEAEQQLERLTAAVEGHEPDELQHFFDGPAPPKLFDDLRSRLAGLTSVTAKYFDALVAELERGLPAVGAPEEGGEGDAGDAGGAGGASGSGGAEGGGAAAEAPAAAQPAAQPAPPRERCVDACMRVVHLWASALTHVSAWFAPQAAWWHRSDAAARRRRRPPQRRRRRRGRGGGGGRGGAARAQRSARRDGTRRGTLALCVPRAAAACLFGVTGVLTHHARRFSFPCRPRMHVRKRLRRARVRNLQHADVSGDAATLRYMGSQNGHTAHTTPRAQRRQRLQY
jgi:hypothetical protein